MMRCPSCNGAKYVKLGFVQDTQRYRCKSCARQWTKRTFAVTYRHRFDAQVIRGAVALLLLTNASTRTAELARAALVQRQREPHDVVALAAQVQRPSRDGKQTLHQNRCRIDVAYR